MSIFLLTGQCGLQLGGELQRRLQSPESTVQQPYFWMKADTESKVLRSQESPSQVSAVRSVSVIRASQNQLTVEIPKGVGRGNNFAFAYADSSMESLTIMEGIVEGMRRRLEQCPIGNLLGTVLIHSLAGGTGSGMGTRLVEIIREEFPENFILSASVLPFDDGDTPLQSYNCLLAMDILQEYVNPYASLSSAGILMLYEKQKRRNADGMILLDNDWFLKRTWRQLTPSSTSRATRFSMAQINQAMSQCLSGCIADSQNGGFNGWDLITNVCPIPSLKLMSCSASPLDSLGSPAQILQNFVEQQICLPNHAQYRRYRHLPASFDLIMRRRCIAAQMYARPKQSELSQLPNPGEIQRKLEQRLGFVPWNPYPLDTIVRAQSSTYQLPAYSLLYNSAVNVEKMESYLNRAVKKLHAKAYVHWYERYWGSDAVSRLRDCCLSAQNVISAYNEFCSDDRVLG